MLWVYFYIDANRKDFDSRIVSDLVINRKRGHKTMTFKVFDSGKNKGLVSTNLSNFLQ